MRTSNFLRLGFLSAGIAACLAIATGCGSDGETAIPPGSDAGQSGAGGGGGSSGAGGLAGAAGQGGAGGHAGVAGAAGSGGAGSGGAAGAGCADDSKCTQTPDTPYCNTATGACVACEQGVAGHACTSGLACCGTLCISVNDDPANCGACGKVCSLTNAEASCAAGQCQIVKCSQGFVDCDLEASNGCESATSCECEAGKKEVCYTGPAGTSGIGACKEGSRTCNAAGSAWGPCEGQVTPSVDSCSDSIDNDCDGIVNNGYPGSPDCACVPGTTASCYDGPAGTDGVGACHAGTRTCLPDGKGYGVCDGEVLPAGEICANNTDDDCNGVVDDVLDVDGDGWTECQGDCCEKPYQCSSPAAVNPGAFEYPGNQVDDDCDGAVDNNLAGCDAALASNSSAGMDYAKAIDLCQATTENPPLDQKRWGIISAQLLMADGTSGMSAESRAIRSGFGNVIGPQKGASLAILSSGAAADPSDTNPAFQDFNGFNTGTSSGAPADWLALNGGALPNAPGCPGASSTTAYNPAMLKLRIRVPTNAQSFSVKSYFFSAEYPEWVCTPFNDFFVALLDSGWSGSPANPADKNLAFYAVGASHYPVGVNLAPTGLFSQCQSDETGCSDGQDGPYCTCASTAELAGTGFDQGGTGCGYSNLKGGGTGWLTIRGNVNPGEVIELRFAVWDVSDAVYDSLVLLDNFEWSVTPSQPGTEG